MPAADGTVYLDYAATSAIRPAAVTRAVAAYLEHNGASPGRGGHRRSVAADRTALVCRQAIAQLLDIRGDAGRIAFFPNATYALNAALHGVLRRGDRVVVTVYDHNAVLRPVHALAAARDVHVLMVPGDPRGVLDAAAFARAIDGARLVVLNAVSNVLGTALDIAGLTAAAHAAGALVLVDTAQLAGEAAFSVASCGADLVAFTGHKGLLGPQGTGGLWVREGVEVVAFAAGGTGGDSLDRAMPSTYPDHLEAGTQNAPGIAGLAAGAQWLIGAGVASVHARAAVHAAALREGLAQVNGIRLLSPDHTAAPIITFTSDAMDPATFAMRLDREYGILARAGLHCAPEVHRLLGTASTGAVRFSAGWATTAEDVARALHAVASLAGVRGLSVSASASSEQTAGQGGS
jgi:selenocysteine lyase/cysteine desulfurase